MYFFPSPKTFFAFCGIFLLSFFLHFTHAQDLGLPPETCPNTPIPLNTPVASSPLYSWDMCANNDLLQTPTVELLRASMPNSFRSEGIHTVYDADNNAWYGFITNREGSGASNTILRMDFGANLLSLPTFTSLGNVGGLLNSPKGIKFIKANGVWYAFISNRSNRNIIRLKFGNALSNYPEASIVNMPLFTSNNSAFLDVVYDATFNRYIIVQVDFGNAIQILNFGTDLESTPTVLRYNSPIPNIFGMSLIKYMGNWYGLTHGGGGDQRMFLLYFGNDFMSNIVFPNYMFLNYNAVFDLATNPGLESWQACQLMQDGVNLIAYAITNSGTLARLNFRTNPNTQPIYTKLGNFGLFAQTISLPNGQSSTANSSLNFSLMNSQWVGFTINRTTGVANGNNLYRMIFPNVCDATPPLSNIANPSVSFRNPGIKYITHTALNTDRNPISDNYMYVDSTIVKDAVVAEFQAIEKCIGEATIFNNISQGNLTQASGWLWDFGNGQTSTAYSPTFTYTQAGNYVVKLKVTNFSGCVNEFTQNIRISNYPIANFKIKQLNCANGTVDFQDLRNIPSVDATPGGQIANRFWTFGDGSTYLTAPINLTNIRKGDFNVPAQGSMPFLANNTPYQPNQRYVVGLAITDDAGCVSSVYRTISFKPEDVPTPNFSISTACVGSFTYFYDQSTASSFAQPTRWKWRIFNASNQKIDSSQVQNPFFLINVVGTYRAELEVGGEFTCSKTFSQNFVVQSGIQSQFRASTLGGGVPLTINFFSLNANAVRHFWNFGNGFTSTQANPTYTFTQKGSYVVSYQAFNASNCGTIAQQLVIVGDAPTDLPVELYKHAEFVVYPNPARSYWEVLPDFLKIVKVLSYTLHDAQGKYITQGEVSENNPRINAQNLGSGLYMLKCETKNQAQTQQWRVKLIKE